MTRTTRSSVPIRRAIEADLDACAQLWFDGWQDAHADILPVELARRRTHVSFRDRLANLLPDVRLAGPIGDPDGLAITKGDELYQLYVLRRARGSGIAAALSTDALDRIRAGGKARAWLACAIGNERAARFYEKSGWRRQGVMTSQLPTDDGIFPLNVWRYEIDL